MTESRRRARLEARARHPASSWAPDHALLRRRIATALADDGHPAPEFSATLFGVRGLLGMNRPTFAAAIGINEERLVALEEGSGLDCDQPTRVVVERMTRSSVPTTSSPSAVADTGEMRRS